MDDIKDFLQAHRKAAWVVAGVVIALALASLLFGTN